jgi:hypothetical protein
MDLGVLIGIITGGLAILGVIVGVIGFFLKLGGRIALQEKTLSENVADTTAAHDKIRGLAAIQAEHTTKIAVVENDITYIRDGIDEIKAAVRR